MARCPTLTLSAAQCYDFLFQQENDFTTSCLIILDKCLIALVVLVTATAVIIQSLIHHCLSQINDAVAAVMMMNEILPDVDSDIEYAEFDDSGGAVMAASRPVLAPGISDSHSREHRLLVSSYYDLLMQR